MVLRVERLSVIIPARNEAGRIAATVSAVLVEAERIRVDAEVIVVDDGSTDDTADVARLAGARVLRLDGLGNPGAARNRGAACSSGATLVFLDADCVPATGWLSALVSAHAAGERCVGGPLALPPGLPTTARWDYYFSSYHMHPDRPGGPVANLTPANLSVRKDVFEATPGFNETHPVADGHEELSLQASLRRHGILCYFEPRALVHHHNRPGMGNLLRRTYRWAYSSIQAKAETGGGRVSGLYRHPWLVVVVAPVGAPLQAVYIAWCWLRAGKLEPIFAFPVLLFTRFVYAAGMMVGGWRWLTGSER
jgi:glycosyltransferase involved in cell wall biosynthesis